MTGLTINELSIGYDNLKNALLKDINLNFFKGNIYSLLGDNGIGKSTFLNTISSQIKPLSGKIKIQGINLETMNTIDKSKLISICSSHYSYPDNATVIDLILMGRYPYTNIWGSYSSNDYEIANELINDFELNQKKDWLVTNLSDGQRQKAFICRAIAQSPEYLLLDEPGSHLSLKSKVFIFQKLREICLNKNICIIYTSHDVSLSLNVSDKVIFLEKSNKIKAFNPTSKNLYKLLKNNFLPSHVKLVKSNIEFRF